MDTKARILAIRLMEMVQKNPVYAKSLGIVVNVTSNLHVP